MNRINYLLLFLTVLFLRMTSVYANATVSLQNIDISTIQNNKVEVRLFFSQPLSSLPVTFSLTNPARLILDLRQVQNGLKEKKKTVNIGVIQNYIAANIEDHVRIIFDLKQPALHDMKIAGNQLIIDFNNPSETPDAGKSQAVKTAPQTAATEQTTPIDKNHLSFNFQDIKVRTAIQLIAEFTGLNLVVSDTVQGSMSLHLENIPWQQALDIILKTQGLGQRQIGNTVLIAPLDEIASRQKQELQAQQQIADLEPLVSELIRINYSKADDLAKLLKDKGNTLLSSRGAVSVDTRTNTLWVQDNQKKLDEIRTLVRHLDTPSRQVLIESRIVSIDKTYEEDLGIRFGITHPTHITGKFNGANQLVGGTNPQAVLDPTLSSIDPTQRLNFNLPAAPTSGSTPASIALALFKMFDNTFLDLELSALESEGLLQIISSPRLITASQQAATISTGQEIPYQEKTSSGATSVSFKQAVLSLTVTPQITPDNRIILALKVQRDKRAPSSQDVQGVPSINTNSIETNVLVNNGQTLVLGGVYEQTNNNGIQRIPFLGKIPVLGKLFTNLQTTNEQFELLIFVTPKIVPQNAFEKNSWETTG